MSRLASLTILATLGAAGCGDEDEVRYTEPVASIDGEVLDQSVVRMLAERDAVDESQAREHALETLRLAAAYREALEGGSAEAVLIEPGRERQLRRSALARLWLEEDFEPKHGLEDIPDELIEQNMGLRSAFHPEVHQLCQVIVQPAEKDPETGRRKLAPDDDAWWADAGAYLEPIEGRLKRYIPDPGTEPGCEFFGKVARRGDDEQDEDMFLKIEQGGYAVCQRESWDEGFSDALCGKAPEPMWVGPFRTRFGLHLAAVVHISPENLPDDAGKRAYLREKMHPTWQKQAFGEYMERLRAKRTVRLGPALRANKPGPAGEG